MMAALMAALMVGCAKESALQFPPMISSEHSPGDAPEGDIDIPHTGFLKLLAQAYTSYEFVSGFKPSFDIEAYLTRNPDQEHFPNSIRFYHTPCIASREIMMLKGEVRYRNRPEFVRFMQDWEAGLNPVPTEADIRYLADMTHLERIRKQHIFKSVTNYCRALGGSVRNSVPLDDQAIQSFFLPVVAHCAMATSRQAPDREMEQAPGHNHDTSVNQPFYFIYNPNILNNSYGYTPKILRSHQLVPFHQRQQETNTFFGHSTVTMITATDDCLKTYPVEFGQDTGVLLYGWDGYFLFVHPEHEGNVDDPRIIYFDRYRKHWPETNTDNPQQGTRPESDAEVNSAPHPASPPLQGATP